jgi:hypothetical protein
MSDTIVAIVSAFFVIGILVGVVTVIAAAVLRGDRRGRAGSGDPADYEPSGPEEPPPGLLWDDTRPDDRPSWPGEAGTDFSGR